MPCTRAAWRGLARGEGARLLKGRDLARRDVLRLSLEILPVGGDRRAARLLLAGRVRLLLLRVELDLGGRDADGQSLADINTASHVPLISETATISEERWTGDNMPPNGI